MLDATVAKKDRPKLRLDQLLVERGLFESRAQASAAIAAGTVLVDGAPARKAAQLVREGQAIIAERAHPFVSRGALKLLAALDHTRLSPSGLVCLDLGASTGGFTDLLLQRGARRVFAVDIGHGQLHPRLAADPRVASLEGQDARKITAVEVNQPVDLLVADLSFIGLAKALPAGLRRVKPGGRIIVLVKPQFEAGPGAGKKGVIRDERLRSEIIARVAGEIAALGIIVEETIPSPITGGEGNHEFLLIGRKAP